MSMEHVLHCHGGNSSVETSRNCDNLDKSDAHKLKCTLWSNQQIEKNTCVLQWIKYSPSQQRHFEMKIQIYNHAKHKANKNGRAHKHFDQKLMRRWWDVDEASMNRWRNLMHRGEIMKRSRLEHEPWYMHAYLQADRSRTREVDCTKIDLWDANKNLHGFHYARLRR